MSGTSLDGLDLCYAHYKLNNGNWEFVIKHSETISYNQEWLKKLTNAPKLNGEELTLLNQQFGKYLGLKAKFFCFQNNISPDFIASHGHTIFHNPNSGYTLQIGNGAEIATNSKIKTCCDFRTTDIALGGQGAPLVPIGDKYLFSKYDACLNLGGFSNISTNTKDAIAFDICPVNMVLNALANELGFDYDKNGNNAKSGILNKELFQNLNELNYYKNPAPKSLGREWVEETINPILRNSTISIQDKLNTFCHHIAEQVTISTKQQNIKNPILTTGGGAKNTFLIECFRKYGLEINIPSEEIVDFKEALIFGFLGVLRVLEIPNTLSSVTGAKKDSISGCIYLP